MEEHAIFIDTSLDTHLALAASLSDTVFDLKEKIRHVHLLCFPNIGEIKVNCLKVNKRDQFYHIADCVPLKCVFARATGAWVLSVDVVRDKSDTRKRMMIDEGTQVPGQNVNSSGGKKKKSIPSQPGDQVMDDTNDTKKKSSTVVAPPELQGKDDVDHRDPPVLVHNVSEPELEKLAPETKAALLEWSKNWRENNSVPHMLAGVKTAVKESNKEAIAQAVTYSSIQSKGSSSKFEPSSSNVKSIDLVAQRAIMASLKKVLFQTVSRHSKHVFVGKR